MYVNVISYAAESSRPAAGRLSYAIWGFDYNFTNYTFTNY